MHTLAPVVSAANAWLCTITITTAATATAGTLALTHQLHSKNAATGAIHNSIPALQVGAIETVTVVVVEAQQSMS